MQLRKKMAQRKKKTTKPRIYVQLTAFWGNGVDSTIKVSRRRWKEIQDGAEYETSAWSWYEGSRFSVYWHFTDGKVSVGGGDGMECVVGLPVTELLAHVNSPE